MGKDNKKRSRKLTVYGCVEGNRERAFLDFLREIYKPESNNVALQIVGSSGGAPDKIVTMALRECHREKSFAWFDEDFAPKQPLTEDVRKSLALCWRVEEPEMAEFLECPLGDIQSKFNSCMRKPVLIVSQPVCCDSLILRILGNELPFNKYDPAPKQRKKQIDGLKNKLNHLMNGKTRIEQQTAYYREYLNIKALEEKRATIVELNLLILMMTND